MRLRAERARGAIQTCVGHAARYELTSPASDRCAAWPGGHFPDRFPPLDELRPAPGWSPLLRPREAPFGASPRDDAAAPGP